MPDEILNKIKYLCKNIPKVEWSGILFYSVQGTITDPKNFKITLEDILPLDMGTSAFTSYNIDERYVDYLMEEGQEHRMEWHMGHIHSHNTMNVFFSGTDLDELDDNSSAHNYYLSLIVNNFMDFTAKVAFRGKVEQVVEAVPFYALNEDGEKYVIETKTFNMTNEKLFVYDCSIISKAEQILVESGFESMVNEIMKPKPAPTPAKSVVPVNSNVPVKKLYTPAKKGKVNGFLDKMTKDVHANIAEDHNEIEIFALTLLNFTNMLGSDDDFDSLMSDIEELEITDMGLSHSIIGSFAALFEHFFPFYDDDGKMFIEVLEGVIEFYEDEEENYPVLKVTVDNLKQMKTKFEEYGTTATT